MRLKSHNYDKFEIMENKMKMTKKIKWCDKTSVMTVEIMTY